MEFTYETVFAMGLYLTGFVISALIVASLLGWAWRWVDDKEGMGNNPIITFFYTRKKEDYYSKEDVIAALTTSYGCRSDRQDYIVSKILGSRNHPSTIRREAEKLAADCKVRVENSRSYSDYVFGFLVIVLLGSVLLPPALLTLFIFYDITLSVALFIALMIFARSARRHKKLFDAHVKDKEAHK